MFHALSISRDWQPNQHDIMRLIQVAVPTPLARTFDYLVPDGMNMPAVGARVRVPFGGRRMLTGVVVGRPERSVVPKARLKSTHQLIDAQPVIPAPLLKLLLWAADYYHHPIGEVIATALPALLRIGRAAEAPGEAVWRLSNPEQNFTSAPIRGALRQRVLAALAAAPAGLDETALRQLSARAVPALGALAKLGLVTMERRHGLKVSTLPRLDPPVLTAAQQHAVAAIDAAAGFRVFLLHGITGSGKTEVYLRIIAAVIARGLQALVLVPEIALTPQLVKRFEQRFSVPIAVLHSGLSDSERLCAWLAARDGTAAIVLGTRSAVYAPLANAGIFVVDEEHDSSYKQQDGFRYSARDVAVLRASRERVPIVLGSATPALESLHKADTGAYHLIELPERTGIAQLPVVELLDMRRLAPADGMSHPLRAAIAERLSRGEQSLLFLNRRGFAPVWMCHDCGWVAPCRRCDARLTLHQARARLRCHHCGAEEVVPVVCPACAQLNLRALGAGTERVERALEKFFPTARIARFDRDSTRARGALARTLDDVHTGRADILVGTQMLSKGHDFPNVTLVGVLNADQGLYSADFRGPERLFQQLLQVGGRAGRAEKPGRVLIQTWHPDHPVYAALLRHDYRAFAEYAAADRRATGFPPFSFLALARAESPKPGAALKFLVAAHALARRCRPDESVTLAEPLPAPMERRAGRYRAQLLVQSRARRALHEFLTDWLAALRELPEAKKVRWAIDVDPVDMH